MMLTNFGVNTLLVLLFSNVLSIGQLEELVLLEIEGLISSMQGIITEAISIIFSPLTGSFLILIAAVRFTLDGKDGKFLFLGGIVLYLVGVPLGQ